jgi:hypothetical protein
VARVMEAYQAVLSDGSTETSPSAGVRSRLLRIAQLTAHEGVALDTHEQ